MPRSILTLTIALVAAQLSSGAGAADRPATPPPLTPNVPGWPSPQTEAKLRGAIDQMVDAFAELLREVPRYAAPEINENGDIILRRLPSPGGPQPPLRPLLPRRDDDRT